MTCIRQNDQASVVDSTARVAGTVASQFRIPTYPTEDLTQDILLKLLSTPKFIDDERSLQSLLRQMAKNLCRDHLRRQKYRKTEDILIVAVTIAMPAEASLSS